MKAKTVGLALLLSALLSGTLDAVPPHPQKFELTLVEISEGPEPEYIFVIGQSGFRSVESLKKFFAAVEPGSELVWNPGCLRNGKEPLLSSEEELKEFRAYLEALGTKFTLIKAG